MALVIYNTSDPTSDKFIPKEFFKLENTFVLKGTLVDIGEDNFFDLYFTVNAKIKISKEAIVEGYPTGLDSLTGLETNLLLVRNDGGFKAKKLNSDDFSDELVFKDNFQFLFKNPENNEFDPLPTDVSRRIGGSSSILEACSRAHT